jgi:hypothetical protein
MGLLTNRCQEVQRMLSAYPIEVPGMTDQPYKLIRPFRRFVELRSAARRSFVLEPPALAPALVESAAPRGGEDPRCSSEGPARPACCGGAAP